MDVRVGLYESRVSNNRCFWTVVLEETLESPLGSKEIEPVHPKYSEYSLAGLMLKLQLQYFGHLMQRTDSLEKTLVLEKIEGRRRRGQQRMRRLGQGDLACCGPWVSKSWTQLSDWTELNWNEDNIVRKESNLRISDWTLSITTSNRPNQTRCSHYVFKKWNRWPGILKKKIYQNSKCFLKKNNTPFNLIFSGNLQDKYVYSKEKSLWIIKIPESLWEEI